MSEQKICPTCGSEYPLSERFCPRDGTALRSSGGDKADLMGTIVADRYHILKKLGEGGMGTVYLAEHVKMGRKAALKVMNPGMNQDPDSIARFNREAANASRLNHPNVCAIYDFGETTDGLIYLAMEFIEGQSLTAVIEKNGYLPAPRAANIIHQAADALGVAHDYGIVHRDLKPDNIMISKTRDGGDLVKVVDFGIAKASSSDAQNVTKTGLVVGTPEYMSPEQLAGDKLDGRSDIYSLGLVAFNCLTGTLPFPSKSAQEAMIMRLTDHPKKLADMKPEVSWPAELQRVMDKALARDAVDRYSTAPEFGRDIARAVENMPATMVAEMGTMVVGAQPVPATRVASPSDKGAATVVAGAAAGGAATTGGKKNLPMMIGGGVVLVAGLAFAAIKMMGGPTTAGPTGADSTSGKAATEAANSSGGSKAPDTKTAANSKTPASPANSKADAASKGAKGGAPPTGGGAEPAAEPPKPSGLPNFSALARNLLDGKTDDAESRRILAQMNSLIPTLAGEKLGDALAVQAFSFAMLNRTKESCAPAKRAKTLTKDPTMLRYIETVLADDACQ